MPSSKRCILNVATGRYVPLQGRLVKRMVDGYRVEGEQMVVWDGTNESNQRVPRGVYFFRIQAPEGSVTRRVAVLSR